jgi:glycosyltransferase involved in cell wall biosynthesis
MKQRTYIFIHQNMPAQFLHMVLHLRGEGHRIHFITKNKENHLRNVNKIPYEVSRTASPNTHHYLHTAENGILHGQAVYRALDNLKRNGVNPDIIVGHAGWGETLLVKDVFPDAPLLSYFEFYYRAHGQDMNFDPEYPSSVDSLISTAFKNTTSLHAFNSCDWGITPTQWQLDTHPAYFHSKMSVIHEGIDTQAIRPNPDASFTTESGKQLRPGQKIVTFVARSLEPYRGFHTFMRAIPEIQRRHPDAEIVIVGSERDGYGRKLAEGDSYKKQLLAEVSFNPDTVHFTGHLATEPFRAVMAVSMAHVYLTYPFILSWSMVESLATGCLVIGSRTAPVEEVIVDRKNGLLVDFPDPRALADTICEVLARPQQFEHLRHAARETAVARYDLRTVTLPRQLALLNSMIRNC